MTGMTIPAQTPTEQAEAAFSETTLSASICIAVLYVPVTNGNPMKIIPAHAEASTKDCPHAGSGCRGRLKRSFALAYNLPDPMLLRWSFGICGSGCGVNS